MVSKLCLSALALLLPAASIYAASFEEHFGDPAQGGYEGCFVAAERDGTVVLRSGDACAEPYPPCSTFKIPNSLIGLETGAVTRETVLPWDGEKKSYRAWERDHDLASAMESSVVWYYQELARRVGEKDMQAWVDRFDYGNRDLSGGLTRFWLGSSLEISADEQIVFLSKLYTGALPVSEASAAVVREILPAVEIENGELAAKTGSCYLEGEDTLGWWVGRLDHGGTERLFATRIRGKEADGRRARELTMKLLADPEVAEAMGLSGPVETKGKS